MTEIELIGRIELDSLRRGDVSIRDISPLSYADKVNLSNLDGQVVVVTMKTAMKVTGASTKYPEAQE